MLQAALESARRVLETTFQNSPKASQLVDALITDENARVLSKRVAFAAERADLISQEATLVSEHDARRAPLVDTVRRAQDALTAARQALRREEAGHMSRVAEVQHRRGLVEKALRLVASPMLPMFAQQLEDEIAATYALRDRVSERDIERRPILLWHNGESVEARAAAIREASRVVRDEWPFAPLSDEQLQERFDALVTGLPAVEARPAKYAGAIGDV